MDIFKLKGGEKKSPANTLTESISGFMKGIMPSAKGGVEEDSVPVGLEREAISEEGREIRAASHDSAG
jgi:hypothetical protein